MTGPITWDVTYAFIGFAGGVLLIWFFIERRIKEAEKELHARISRHADDLTAYKLWATQQFASHQHLKEVEVRLADAIGRLTNRVEQLPSKFAEEVVRIVDSKPSRR
ncbi:MAG: hypothetical protein ACOZAM_15030 [Pseudomonadota bacterium]